jgi:hypothetical protein
MHYLVAHFRQIQHSQESQVFINDPYGYVLNSKISLV